MGMKSVKISFRNHIVIHKKLLQPWLVWLSRLRAGLQNKRLLVQFPVREHTRVVGQVRSQVGGIQRGNRMLGLPLFFPPLSLSFSLPYPPSKINK